MHRTVRLTALVVSCAKLAGLAIACPPPPPPPPPPPWGAHVSKLDADALLNLWITTQKGLRDLREADAQSQRQHGLFDRSEAVLIARLDRIDGVRIADPQTRWILKPVQWLKGDPIEGELSLAPEGWTSCGPTPSFHAFSGSVGETFAVFLDIRDLSQEHTLGVVSVGSIRDSILLEGVVQAIRRDHPIETGTSRNPG